MIKLKNIDFGYFPKRKIFSDLNLNLEAGHIYGLLGKNGMGKTTLLKIISGLRFANSGTATAFGQNVEKRNPEMLSDIYFVTEEMDVPQIKISEFVEIYSLFYPNFSRADFDKYIQKFEMDGIDAKLTQLSHGQKKKVLVSFALATNTKLLIMDEPTNGMDIPSKSTFRKVVASAFSEDKTIIISTHQVRDLQNLIDAVVVLDKGQILLNETVNDISEKLSVKVLSISNYENLMREGKIIYAEDNYMGKIAVCENTDDEAGNIDMELLFCAVIENRERIHNIFKQKQNTNKNSDNTQSNFATEMENIINSNNQ